MDIKTRRIFGAGLMLATSVASLAAFSQELAEPVSADEAAEIEALEPGVDTSASTFDPARPTAVLAQNASRPVPTSGVMDSIELSATQVTGNQELPTVLYIVPWQKAEPGDLVGKPVNTLLDEVLAPIDREEFVRSVDYYGDIYGAEEE